LGLSPNAPNINGANTYQFAGEGPVGRVDASGEIFIDGTNLSPPSPAPPSAPKKCCPPFSALVNTWKKWVADYRNAKMTYSALVFEQGAAQGNNNDYTTASVEMQQAQAQIQVAQGDLLALKMLKLTTDLPVLGATIGVAIIAAEGHIMELESQYRAIENDVTYLAQMYLKSLPPLADVTNYLKLQGYVIGDAFNYNLDLQFC
jgi:hypothetical protein